MTRRRAADGDPQRLGDALAEVSRELGLPDPEQLGRLLAAWPDLVGRAVAEHARLRALRDGVLTVAVDAPAWATQLRYLESDLVTRISEQVAAGVVERVRIVVEATVGDSREGSARGPRDPRRSS